MKKCEACGGLVEDHVRFHHPPEGCGKYTDGIQPGEARLPTLEEARARGATSLSDTLDLQIQRPESGGKRSNKRPADLSWLQSMWSDTDPARAPAPPEAPDPRTWGKEADLRADAVKLLRSLGYAVYDLEQGYRDERGGSRQTPGIGDAYFQGHGRRGWIEFKRWDNTPSPDQINFASSELAAGGIYLLVYSARQLLRWHQLHGGTP